MHVEGEVGVDPLLRLVRPKIHTPLVGLTNTGLRDAFNQQRLFEVLLLATTTERVRAGQIYMARSHALPAVRDQRDASIAAPIQIYKLFVLF